MISHVYKVITQLEHCSRTLKGNCIHSASSYQQDAAITGACTDAVKDVTIAGQMRTISEQLLSTTSPAAITQACELLTALIVRRAADEWEESVTKMVVSCLLPHVTAASSAKAEMDTESVGASMAAITSLCAIASHGINNVPEQLAKQGAVSAAVAAAQALLTPGPAGLPEETYNRVSAIIKGAILPIVREGPATIVLAGTRDATTNPPFHALALLGGMLLECCKASDDANKAQVTVALLSVLQCAHAILSHGNLELLNACCKAGMKSLDNSTGPCVAAVNVTLHIIELLPRSLVTLVGSASELQHWMWHHTSVRKDK